VRRRTTTSLGQDKPDPELGLSDLVARTGVPAPTLHHWLRLGVLPPPVRSGSRRNTYDQRHIQAARLIRVLRERRGLSLEEIAAVLPTLLEAGEQEAFRPEMWSAAIAAHIRRVQPAAPPPELLDAAAAAFAHLGYGEVRVDDLCAAVGMAKGSFYRWFTSKDDAYNAAVRHVGTRVDAELRAREPPATPEEAVVLLAEAVRPHLALLLEAGSRAVRGDAAAAGALGSSIAAIERTLSSVSGFSSQGGRTWLETVFGKAALSAVGVSPLTAAASSV
jgi:AcrR family transcriptional regulator/predicted DNA-binding transcriptional regulator AlpA